MISTQGKRTKIHGQLEIEGVKTIGINTKSCVKKQDVNQFSCQVIYISIFVNFTLFFSFLNRSPSLGSGTIAQVTILTT